MTQLAKQQHPDGASSVERTRETPTYTPRFDIWETDEELILYGDSYTPNTVSVTSTGPLPSARRSTAARSPPN